MAADNNDFRWSAMKPTMGSQRDKYALLANVVARNGVLEHRPTIEFVAHGFSSPDYTSAPDDWDLKLAANEHGSFIGIDVAVVDRRLVCLWLHETLNGGDYKLTFSLHHPGEPKLGVASFQFITPPVALEVGASESKINTTNPFWDLRIVKGPEGFMITGKGSGAGRLDVNNVTASASAQDIHYFLRDNVRALHAVLASDPILRVDPNSKNYVSHRPRRAFCHVDKFGRGIWYGFEDYDAYTLLQALPDSDFGGEIPPELVVNGRLAVRTARSAVWFSESYSPLSLPSYGLVSTDVSGGGAEVVGITDFKDGIAIFTANAIQYVQGVPEVPGSMQKLILATSPSCAARLSIQPVAGGVVFAASDGLWFLAGNGQLAKIDAFDQLFGDGVDADHAPNSAVWSSPLSFTGAEMSNANTFDTWPWRRWKIDKSRLERAVAGVWNDLYLLAVSLDGDKVGWEDNRLILCWNWRENTGSVWLMPWGYGWRGFAYDGTISTPFVMTRVGLCRLNPNGWADRRTALTSDVLLPVVYGRTHAIPETGDTFVQPAVLVAHDATLDPEYDAGSGKEIGRKMMIQAWNTVSDMEIGTVGETVTTGAHAEQSPLDGVWSGAFTAWRGSHDRSPNATPDANRVEGIKRLSRAVFSALGRRHVVQFSTQQPGDIRSVQLGWRGTAPRGRRS